MALSSSKPPAPEPAWARHGRQHLSDELKAEEASIPLTNLVICVIYLLPYVMTWSWITAQISLPILQPVFRFLQQLGHCLWYLYWGAPCGESVRTGAPAAGQSTGHCRSGAVHGASGATNTADGRSNATHRTGKTGYQQRKRKRKDDEEDEPPDKTANSDHGQLPTPFACPFYLNDRHGWHNCLRNYTLNRIVDVRLHLLRVHLLAPQCPVCGREFEGDPAGENQCNTHIQLRNCQPSTSSPPARCGITRDQLEDIRRIAARRIGRRRTDPAAAKWFEIWDIIFPRTTRPDSPYIRDHPDVQRVRDMTDFIFAGEGWRDLILPIGDNGPSLRDVSRSTLVAIADGFVALYRRIYQDQDTPSPEPVANAVVDIPVASSVDDSLPQPRSWEVISTPSQLAQATEDPSPSQRPTRAAASQNPSTVQQSHGYNLLGGRLESNPMAQVNRTLSSLPSDLDFFTEAQAQDSMFSFQDLDDSFGVPVQRGSPSQLLNNYGSNPSGFWGDLGGDPEDTA